MHLMQIIFKKLNAQPSNILLSNILLSDKLFLFSSFSIKVNDQSQFENFCHQPFQLENVKAELGYNTD
jgi:hypothetical protein